MRDDPQVADRSSFMRSRRVAAASKCSSSIDGPYDYESRVIGCAKTMVSLISHNWRLSYVARD